MKSKPLYITLTGDNSTMTNFNRKIIWIFTGAGQLILFTWFEKLLLLMFGRETFCFIGKMTVQAAGENGCIKPRVSYETSFVSI